jgi:NADPH:quinone reductase-like Zn-dependent oxidoreductase
VLRVETLDVPQLDATSALVAVRAASINPSDVGNVAGRFPQTTLPRTPGRDYAGVVVEGPAGWVGAEVWGTGDGGFARDGSHAGFVAVPGASLRKKPARLSFAQAASAGVTFVAAWLGVIDYAALRPGETLVVIGAAGGVGGAAVQIGRWTGARVIGVDRIVPEANSPAAVADDFVTPEPADSARVVNELTAGRGADVVLNAVGGPTFEPSLHMLAHAGRLAVLASPGERRQSFDLIDFYRNESRIFGIDTLKRDATASALILERLAPGFESGALRAPAIAAAFPLDRAAEAYRLASGPAHGRVVFEPQPA